MAEGTVAAAPNPCIALPTINSTGSFANDVPSDQALSQSMPRVTTGRGPMWSERAAKRRRNPPNVRAYCTGRKRDQHRYEEDRSDTYTAENPWQCRRRDPEVLLHGRQSDRHRTITASPVTSYQPRNLTPPRRTHNMSSTSFAVAVMQMIINFLRGDDARRMSRCGASCSLICASDVCCGSCLVSSIFASAVFATTQCIHEDNAKSCHVLIRSHSISSWFPFSAIERRSRLMRHMMGKL
jgi:hypothetical protein